MRRAFFAADRPLVFAHRGGAGLAPENTLAAFDHALALGADGLELDVRLSRDGVVVVHHDATLDRTTDRVGSLAASGADDLARADAGHHFRRDDGWPYRGMGFGVPRLDLVLRRYASCRIIVELKTNSEALAHAVVGVVKDAGAADRVCLGGFRSRPLRVARQGDSSIATSAGRAEVRWAVYRSWLRLPLAGKYDGFQVPEVSRGTRIVSPRFVRAAHLAGLGVHVWTVNEVDQAERLLSWGVDGLITDRPDLLVPFVRAFAARARTRRSSSPT